MYTDITIKCKDCGEEFIFTAGEQEFYAEKGLDTAPQRCRSCRGRRKHRRDTMLYEIVCERCGEVVRIPFEPTPERPSYCGACYRMLKDR